MGCHRQEFDARRLALVAAGEEFRDDREPPLRFGDVVRLNSGGPNCLIVDIPDPASVVIAWRSPDATISECVLPRECLHRIDVTR